MVCASLLRSEQGGKEAKLYHLFIIIRLLFPSHFHLGDLRGILDRTVTCLEYGGERGGRQKNRRRHPLVFTYRKSPQTAAKIIMRSYDSIIVLLLL